MVLKIVTVHSSPVQNKINLNFGQNTSIQTPI